MSMQAIIIKYYDSVIHEIDIDTEKRLERLSDDKKECEMLNARRDEMIAIVKRLNVEAIEFYETTMKQQLKNDEYLATLEKSSQERLEYLERKLFAKKFVVFLPYLWRSLVVIDFYLKKSYREILK